MINLKVFSVIFPLVLIGCFIWMFTSPFPPSLPVPPGPPMLCPMGMALSSMPVEYITEHMLAQEQGQDPPPVVCGEDDGSCNGNPTHVEPKDFCYSMPSKDKAACTCTRNATDLCKPGNEGKEHMSCNSWCWRQKWCKCCKS